MIRKIVVISVALNVLLSIPFVYMLMKFRMVADFEDTRRSISSDMYDDACYEMCINNCRSEKYLEAIAISRGTTFEEVESFFIFDKKSLVEVVDHSDSITSQSLKYQGNTIDYDKIVHISHPDAYFLFREGRLVNIVGAGRSRAEKVPAINEIIKKQLSGSQARLVIE